MRVKYMTAPISGTFSVNGGSTSDKENLARTILMTLAAMGAPLNTDALNVSSGSGWAEVYSCFLGEDLNGALMPANMMISIEVISSNIVLGVAGFGRGSEGDNYFYSNSNIAPSIGTTGSKSYALTIHAVKSDDSFYFGFVPQSAPAGAGCINYAITPMTRLANPNENVGYALVAGALFSSQNYSAMAFKTRPYIEGMNYYNGWFNQSIMPDTGSFPEVSTGKIPLVPFFSGCEDIYYKNIYVTPVSRDSLEEKAFETDKGVFLIAGDVNQDYTGSGFCQLAFDITEAANA